MSTPVEWLYYTLYPGSAERLDAVVEQIVAPAAAAGRATDGIARWFFLRYTDELGSHVRLRFAGAPDALDALQGALDDTLEARLREAAATPRTGHVGWHHALYEPEHDKFGGPAGVALSEEVFHASSELVLALSRTRAWAPLERRAAGLWIMAETLAAAGAGCDPPTFWQGYGWYWSGADHPGAAALRARTETAAARQAPRLRGLAAQLASDPAVRGPVDAYLGVVADACAELSGRGSPPLDRYAFHFLHLMSNRLGIAILEEAFLAVVLAGDQPGGEAEGAGAAHRRAASSVRERTSSSARRAHSAA